METTPIQRDDDATTPRAPENSLSPEATVPPMMDPEDQVETETDPAAHGESKDVGEGKPELAGAKPEGEQDMASTDNSENKKARTEDPDQDDDEKQEEEEKEAAKNEEATVSESKNEETNTLEQDGAVDSEESKDKEDSQQQTQIIPPPQQEAMMMMQHQPFPMAPGMMAHGGGGPMMMGAGTPRQAMMGMPPFYSAGFGFPSQFGLGAANMAMQQQQFAMQQQQMMMMMQQQQPQQQHYQGAETGKKKRKGHASKSDKDSPNNNKQQNPPQFPGHVGMAASGYSPTMFFPNTFFNPFGAVGPFGGNRPPGIAENRGIGLSLACDGEQLSDYQRFIRQHLELFEAGPEDCESNTQGRKRAVHLGQVGLRCRHCSHLPLRSRGRGAVYYPARLAGVYQAAQNMAQSHLTGSCERIPVRIKEELLLLRQRRDNASGGKQYWADGCRALGVYETETKGLKLRQRDDPLLAMATSGPTTSDPQLGGGVAQCETEPNG